MNTPNRSVPYNTKAEEAVLGAVMIDPQAYNKVADFLMPEMFYLRKHRLVYEAALLIIERRDPLDFLTLMSEMEKRGTLDEIGGAVFIAELINAVPSAVNVEAYARLIQETHTRRRLLDIASDAARLAYAEGNNIDRAIDTVQTALYQLRAKSERNEPHSFATISREVWDDLERTISGEAVPLLKTGYCDLDAKLGGLAPTDVCIIGARPGDGKSALLCNLAIRGALHGKNILMFSLEMSRKQVFGRMLVNQGLATTDELRNGKIPDTRIPHLMEGFARHAELPIWVDDTAGISIESIRAKTMRLHSEHHIDILMLDYMQLITTTTKHDTRQQYLGHISREVKKLAKDLEITVFVATQLKRLDNTGSAGRKPTMNDLRESGDFEQDADQIILIHHEPCHADMQIKPALFIVEKNRHGKTGDVRIGWQSDRVAFLPLARDSQGRA